MPFDQANIESPRTSLLRRARELITPVENWCTGALINERGQRCAIGALEWAARGSELSYGEALVLLAKHSDRCDSDPRFTVALHNNENGHRATLAMFDAAIAESAMLDVAAR